MKKSALKALVVDHIQKCRFCLMRFYGRKKPIRITKPMESRFKEITGIEVNLKIFAKNFCQQNFLFKLQLSDSFSNVVCEKCDSELKNFSTFQQELTTKQKYLQEHVNGKSVDNEFIKVEPRNDFFEVFCSIKDEDAVEIKSEVVDDSYTDFTFYDPTLFEGNQIIEEQPAEVPKDETRTCTICDKEYVDKYVLKKHLKKKHEQLFDELYPNERIEQEKTKEELRNEARAATITCPDCGKDFRRKCFKVHYKRQHERSQILTCDLCGYFCYIRKDLLRHMRCRHRPKVTSESRVESSEEPEEPEQPMESKCPICSKVFKSRVNVRMHVHWMHRMRRFKCDICGKEFVHNYALQSHIRTGHSKYPEYLCSHCGKGFAVMNLLK